MTRHPRVLAALVAILVTAGLLAIGSSAFGSFEGCTTNASSFNAKTYTLTQKAVMAGCRRGKLVIGTEFFADGVRVPGGGIRNTTCRKSTHCSTPSKITQECFAPGQYEVLALGRHGGVIDTPEYTFTVGEAAAKDEARSARC